jgi:hypothetical protein
MKALQIRCTAPNKLLLIPKDMTETYRKIYAIHTYFNLIQSFGLARGRH